MPKSFYFILAWVCVGLGILGALLPIMPTTIFLIIAAWSFSKSSEKYHKWLIEHPTFGPTLYGWEKHHAIPKKARSIALLMLLISYTITATIFGIFSVAALIMGVILVTIALYLLHLPLLETKLSAKPTCPSHEKR